MRKPMVTRTFTTLTANIMLVDTSTGVVTTETYTFPRVIDDKKVLKECEKILAGSTIKPVAVTSRQEVETLYGMSEEDFLKYAEVMPPRVTTE